MRKGVSWLLAALVSLMLWGFLVALGLAAYDLFRDMRSGG